MDQHELYRVARKSGNGRRIADTLLSQACTDAVIANVNGDTLMARAKSIQANFWRRRARKHEPSTPPAGSAEAAISGLRRLQREILGSCWNLGR